MNNVDPADFQPSTQNINGSAGGIIILTPESDTKRVQMVVPPQLGDPHCFLARCDGQQLAHDQVAARKAQAQRQPRMAPR